MFGICIVWLPPKVHSYALFKNILFKAHDSKAFWIFRFLCIMQLLDYCFNSLWFGAGMIWYKSINFSKVKLCLCYFIFEANKTISNTKTDTKSTMILFSVFNFCLILFLIPNCSVLFVFCFRFCFSFCVQMGCNNDFISVFCIFFWWQCNIHCCYN